jgi:hypothetical protein
MAPIARRGHLLETGRRHLPGEYLRTAYSHTFARCFGPMRIDRKLVLDPSVPTLFH